MRDFDWSEAELSPGAQWHPIGDTPGGDSLIERAEVRL